METAAFLEHIDLPRSLVEDIATHLSDAFFEGKLHPGQPLIETELQQLLGVSRAPLRRHWDFHRVFSEGSRNTELCERIAAMRRESLRLSYSVTYSEHNHPASQKTHRRIVDLLRKDHPEAVELAVQSHILGAIDKYVQFLKETYPELGAAD